jgi:AcrR family transcriptional regulator
MTETALRPRSRTYKGMSLEERANSRKQRFLIAGKAVFGELGFQGANVKDVCAAAGLTERYYYEAFGSLQKLFEAVYLEALDRLWQVFDDAASQSPEDSGAQLRLIIDSYFELLKSDRNLARILVIEIYGAAPAITHLYERGVRQFAARLEKLIAPDAGIGYAFDRGLVAVALVGATSALALHWRLGGYKVSVTVLTDHCFGIFAAVLGRKSFVAASPCGSSVV